MKLKFTNKYFRWGLTAFLVIIASVLFVYTLFNGVNIKEGFSNATKVLMPVIFGLTIAYLLTPVLNFTEDKLMVPLFKKLGFKHLERKAKLIRGICIVITGCLFVLLIYILIAMMLSQIVPSITNIIKNFDHYVENGQNWVNGVLEGNPEMRDNALNVYNKYSEDIEKFLNETVLQKTSQFIMTISLSVINVLKVLWDFIIGFIISIYVLASKERFAGQAKKIIYAIFERDTANIVINDFKFTHKTFIGFIGGKAVDSIIIGLLCFIGTTLMGTPYASLISLVIGVTNIIPFFGPFVGGIPCSFLVFIVDPTKPLQCVYFMLFVLALQQFDGNILGPKILGSSTGLAGFWVIFAITVFGGMWGVFGMIVGVPIFAVLFAAIRSLVNASLYKKKLPTDSRKYINACMVSNEGIESVEDELADPKLIMHNPEVSTWYGDKFVCNIEEHQELIQEHIRLAKEKAEKKQNENKDSNVKSSKGSK